MGVIDENLKINNSSIRAKFTFKHSFYVNQIDMQVVAKFYSFFSVSTGFVAAALKERYATAHIAII